MMEKRSQCNNQQSNIKINNKNQQERPDSWLPETQGSFFSDWHTWQRYSIDCWMWAFHSGQIRSLGSTGSWLCIWWLVIVVETGTLLILLACCGKSVMDQPDLVADVSIISDTSVKPELLFLISYMNLTIKPCQTHCFLSHLPDVWPGRPHRTSLCSLCWVRGSRQRLRCYHWMLWLSKTKCQMSFLNKWSLWKT